MNSPLNNGNSAIPIVRTSEANANVLRGWRSTQSSMRRYAGLIHAINGGSAAFNDARAKADQVSGAEMANMQSGMGLPPGFKLPGM